MDVASSVAQPRPTVALVAAPGARLAANDEVSITVYMGEVPAFVEEQLLTLYGSIFSSLAHIGAQGRLQTGRANTYAAHRKGEYIAVLLFEIENGIVQVFNEVMQIDLQEISRFAGYVFSTYSAAKMISFKAIRTHDQSCTPFPYTIQRYNYLEDIVISLPTTKEQYSIGLGKKNHRNIKRHNERLIREFPSFSFRVVLNEALGESNLREIIALKQVRMQTKGKVSSHDESAVGCIGDMVNAHGLTGLAFIDGKICAGAICYRVGNHFYLSILAHDPAYDHCGIGILCCYHTICECIARGGEEFHFLWGEQRYKTMLLGVPRELDNLVIYRSWAGLLRHADVAISHAIRGRTRQVKRFLQAAEREQRVLGKVVLAVTRFFRRGLRLIKEGVWGA